MIFLLILLGFALVGIGGALFYRKQKVPGGLFILVGVLCVALGMIFLLSFHP
jgi:hypothetical protein